MNRKRLMVLTGCLLLAGTGIMARSLEVMVLQHELWSERARRQQQQFLRVPGPRGDILSADGYVLATSSDRLAAQLDTHLLSYPALFARAAAPLVGVPVERLAHRLEHGPRNQWLAQRMDRERAEALRALAPDAVVLVPDSERVYPLGSLAAPVLGFVGREELRTVGRAGFEHHYDALLAGEPETYLTVNDAVQRRLRLERLSSGHAGYDLELTLHARIQAACEAELAAAVTEQRARAASAVVLEVDTGAVLAVGSLPSFDPSDPGAVPPDHWRLRAVQDAYEPGSLVKPMVAAAALAGGAVHPGDRFDCRHHGIEVAGHWFRDHAKPGMYSLDEIVAESANAGIIEVADRLAPRQLWRALDVFGFGRRTGVGFPAEGTGILPPPATWSRLSAASLALGQEVTATPLQVAVAYAAIANGGWLLRPRLVQRVSADGQSVDGDEHWRSRVLDERLAARVTTMLEGVVTVGTGREAQVPGYRVAGKTGTAQRAVDGAFDDVHHVAWFAGFLPVPHPRVVVVVAVVEPTADFWGSTVAAPVFARIAEAVATQLGLPPDGVEGRRSGADAT